MWMGIYGGPKRRRVARARVRTGVRERVRALYRACACANSCPRARVRLVSVRTGVLTGANRRPADYLSGALPCEINGVASIVCPTLWGTREIPMLNVTFERCSMG